MAASPIALAGRGHERDEGGCVVVRLPPDRYSLPSTRSTTQHPRTCGPLPRQWVRMSSLVHPLGWCCPAYQGSLLRAGNEEDGTCTRHFSA